MQDYGFTQEVQSVTCNLADDERITEAKIYMGMAQQYYSLLGIRFITNQKACPLFGVQTSDLEHVSGHRLLFISADQGITLLKELRLHFDYDCQTH